MKRVLRYERLPLSVFLLCSLLAEQSESFSLFVGTRGLASFSTTRNTCRDSSLSPFRCVENDLKRLDRGCFDKARIILLSQVGDENSEATKSTFVPSTSSEIGGTAPRGRGIASVEKFTRLPVWPVWNGVFVWIVSKLLGDTIAAQVEHTITGRVCPNFFTYEKTSPFIMLVHHCHSFAPWDPLRYLQKTFFPEGFPAHPHRGFVTLTYFLHGGFVHRDSIGCRQAYGQFDNNDKNGFISNRQKHTQWLNTGAGILHEEMFDNQDSGQQPSWLVPTRQELYQLWINLPAAKKLETPKSVLLGGEEETPLVVKSGCGGGSSGVDIQSETLVLAGSYNDRESVAPIASGMTILHVRLYKSSNSESDWIIDLPASYDTAMLYVRQGSVIDSISGTVVPPHHTAEFSQSQASDLGETRRIRLTKAPGDRVADFLFLAGESLNEPCVAQGSMVMTSTMEIDRAYRDYQAGLFGRPWDEKLSDEEWEKHVLQYPSRYRYIE